MKRYIVSTGMVSEYIKFLFMRFVVNFRLFCLHAEYEKA